MIHDLSPMTPHKAMAWLEDRVALKSPEAALLKEIIVTFGHQAGRYEIAMRTLINVLRLHAEDAMIPKDALFAILAPVKEIVAQYPVVKTNGHKPVAAGPNGG